ncbi:hypothetical protein [Pseudofrankia saprophytica]|uniref:hypothetical protein n=1 Tax=Pseudofrankia saprophytica TaxID=298655 RepID=UPI0002DEA5AC|nr:hypothetical protein [Pseudofrankia saprophytica]OHV32934.1 hypothetical protein BCD49_27730 [Pseudofrankia sp. EUN1h]
MTVDQSTVRVQHGRAAADEPPWDVSPCAGVTERRMSGSAADLQGTTADRKRGADTAASAG